jgi:hypothetical protein
LVQLDFSQSQKVLTPELIAQVFQVGACAGPGLGLLPEATW